MTDQCVNPCGDFDRGESLHSTPPAQHVKKHWFSSIKEQTYAPASNQMPAILGCWLPLYVCVQVMHSANSRLTVPCAQVSTSTPRGLTTMHTKPVGSHHKHDCTRHHSMQLLFLIHAVPMTGTMPDGQAGCTCNTGATEDDPVQEHPNAACCSADASSST